MENIDFDKFKSFLRSDGYFVTKARLRLYALLYHHPAITIKELIKLADKNDQSTIYRNIELFERLGIVTRLRLGWHTKIELSDKFQNHHHHITCKKCGKVQDIPEEPTLETTILKIAQSYNFRMTDHHIEIKGTCSRCIQNKK